MATLPDGIIRAMCGNLDSGISKIFTSGIRNPKKRLLVETEILGLGAWNTAQGIRNPTKESRIQVPQSLESSIWNPESR